jgi:hypothetical protein
LAVAIAEEAEITDAMKPMRQNMEEKATDEFLGGKCHGFLLTVVSIVLISEAHLTVFDVQQAVVRDGYAVGVAADVIQHFFGSGEGRLGIDNPVRLTERLQVTEKLATILELFQGGEEFQFAVLFRLTQSFFDPKNVVNCLHD